MFRQSLQSEMTPLLAFWAGSGNVEIIVNALKKLEFVEKFEKLLLGGYVKFLYKDGFRLDAINNKEDFFVVFPCGCRILH